MVVFNVNLVDNVMPVCTAKPRFRRQSGVADSVYLQLLAIGIAGGLAAVISRCEDMTQTGPIRQFTWLV